MTSTAKFDPARYFDRVVVINLRQRPDRLSRFRQTFRESKWPFQKPEIFEAVDGKLVPPPSKWRSGSGAWGCMKSHQTILEQAIADGIDRLLVLEDDVCFVENFHTKIVKFLQTVPKSWDQLMIGGQHFSHHGPPKYVKPGVYRCFDCERTHCYAVRGAYMRKLLERWHGGGALDGAVHCDWIMGRDPELQLAHKVYCPPFFLAGQHEDTSNITSQPNHRRFWNPPGPDLPVINLHAPLKVAAALGKLGWHSGYHLDSKTGIEITLQRIFLETEDQPERRIKLLGDWIKLVQEQVASDPKLICTIWHPQATRELVEAASIWRRIYDITATSVDDALRQLPRKWGNSARSKK